MAGKINDNYFLKLAKARKTTYEFNDKKVKEFSLKKIMEAARWAPSCTNIQPWHFIIVKDGKKITELMMSANYGDFHADPALIIALVLLKKSCSGNGYSCFRGKDSGVHDSYMSMGMAGLNMALEARDLGIDSCIVTPDQDVVKKILRVRKEDAVPLLIGFGYQYHKAFQKERVRRKLSETTSFEYFGGKNE